jgi:hypothetical protein
MREKMRKLLSIPLLVDSIASLNNTVITLTTRRLLKISEVSDITAWQQTGDLLL